MLIRRLFLVIALLLSDGTMVAQNTGPPSLTIFAAASLTDAFLELAAVFTEAHPDTRFSFNFGGSSTLAAQIDQGAPADLFASANIRQMQMACEAGRIGGEPVIFARNRLVLITPADNPAGIESLSDLANPGLLLLLASPGVPVRDYTDAMLDQMADDPAYGPDYRAAVLANLVSEEDNVRHVAAKVALGEADAGIVYSSDVTPDIAEQVQRFSIPDEVNTLAIYPVAITDNPANPALAQAFIDLLLSDEGQAVLMRWGFISAQDAVEEADAEATPESRDTNPETDTELHETDKPEATRIICD